MKLLEMIELINGPVRIVCPNGVRIDAENSDDLKRLIEKDLLKDYEIECIEAYPKLRFDSNAFPQNEYAFIEITTKDTE